MDPPKDKWNLIYGILVFHGIGTLTAWNMFITAKDYFEQYKLANAPAYSQNFLAHIGLASQIPNFFFNWFNVFVQIGGKLTYRILFSLVMEILIFIFTIILAMLDTSAWPGVFFWLTMISVFFLNGFNAIYQNSMYGVAARLPARYMGALVLGSNVCGTTVVLLSWVSKNFENLRTSAIYYFIGGMTVLLICFDTYFAFPLIKFYRHHYILYTASRMQFEPAVKEATPYKILFRQAAEQLYNIFFTFFVSLSVFPAVVSDIKPVKKGFLGENFVLITCFFTFNFTAMVGNITASLYQIPGPRYLTVFTSVRVLFIPFFLLCNYQPARRSMSVLIKSDWIYWLGTALLGWSSGHGSSLGMMYVTGTVASQYASKAGMIGAAVLMTGITSGIVFTRVCPLVVM